MKARFDSHTSVEPLGDGVFRANMHREWWIIAGPNGGYLAAIMLRAMQEAVGDDERMPRTLTLHYTGRPKEGPVDVRVQVEHSGRSLTTVAARMVQEGRPVIVALASFSKQRSSPQFRHLEMPEARPVETCERGGGDVPMHAQYEFRWAMDATPWSGAEHAVLGAWLRLSEPRALDALALAAYCDALPPAIFACLEPDEGNGVPTLELTVHFLEALPIRGYDADDYVLVVKDTPQLVDGFFQEDAAIWGKDGRLLARSRQLAVFL